MSAAATQINEEGVRYTATTTADDAPPRYKRSEVGIIPEDWEVRSLESLAQVERGKFTARPRNDPKYYGGTIPFIQTGDVTNSNGQIKSYSQTLNPEGLKVSKLFPRGTLFFTIAANIGDVGFASFDTACPDSLVAIRTTEETDKTWLAYELAKRKSSFESIATQNAQLNINLEKLKPYLLPVPPLSEQHAIAEALSDVDRLLGALESLIAKKRAIKQAAMQQLLTSKTRLPGFSGDWEQSTVGEEFRIQLGKMLDASKNTGVAKSYLGNAAVQWGHIVSQNLPTVPLTPNDMARFRLRSGDLLVCEGGEVGRSAIWDEPIPECYFQKAIHRLRPIGGYEPQLLMAYLQHWSANGGLSDYVTQTSIAHLPKERFATIPLPKPSVSEQRAIATVLSDMDAEIKSLERRRDKTQAIKQGMMQQLLTGRVRLVEPAADGERAS